MLPRNVIGIYRNGWGIALLTDKIQTLFDREEIFGQYSISPNCCIIINNNDIATRWY